MIDNSALLPEALAKLNLPASCIEDAWPCRGIDDNVLRSFVASSDKHRTKLTLPLSSDVDSDKLRTAWTQVAECNPLLRTRLVASTPYIGLLIVLKNGLSWSSSSTNPAETAPSREQVLLSEFELVQIHDKPTSLIWTVHALLVNESYLNDILEQVVAAYSRPQIPGAPNGVHHGRVELPSTHIRNQPDEQLAIGNGHLVSSVPSGSFRSPLADCVVTLPEQEPILLHSSADAAALYGAAWALLLSMQTNADTVEIVTLYLDQRVSLTGDGIRPNIPTSTRRSRTSVDWSMSVHDFINTAGEELLPVQIARGDSQDIDLTKSNEDQLSGLHSLLITNPPHGSRAPAFFGGGAIQTSDLRGVYPYTYVTNPVEARNVSGVCFEAIFDENFMSRKRATQLLGQYQHLVRCLNRAERNQPLYSLELLSSIERQQLLDSAPMYPQSIDQCVHQLIEQRSKLRPSAAAIKAWDGSFTYEELDECSDRLAGHLTLLGVHAETAVLICFDKSAWAAISMLAILKAGGAIVAVDPTDSTERIKTIISAASVNVALVDLQHSSLIHGLLEHVIVVDPKSIAKLPHTRSPHSTVQPGNTAFIIFTSGSTGNPKGVVLEHRSICTSAEASGNAKHIDEHARVFQFSSYVFDGSIQDHFFTWIRGGCVCIPSEQDRTSNLAKTINQLEVNWMFLTPSVISLLSPADVPQLKVLTLGGEALTSENVRAWAGSVTVQNTYGPAECSVGCCVKEYTDANGDPRVIGFPIGCVAWISNSSCHDQLLPLGCIGELLLEGPMLARCYLGDTTTTARFFIESPPWLPARPPHADRRIYKTGDLVKRNPDGSLTFLGRKDDQVKLRGQRVAISDLNDFFSRSVLIKHAHVSVPASGPLAQTLVCVMALNSISADFKDSTAFEVLSKSQAIVARAEIEKLQGQLAGLFPNYMIPTTWIPIRNLPFTPSNKIDGVKIRKWLQSLDETTLAAIATLQNASTFEEPTEAVEQELQKAWSEILKVPVGIIGKNSTFLALGGNSLRAMALTANLRSRGLFLPVAKILRCEHLSAMAKAVEVLNERVVDQDSRPFQLIQSQSLARIASQCGMEEEAIEDVYLATPFQEALVSLTAKDPGAYVVQRSFHMSDHIDLARLRSAWLATSRANPILRTRFTHDLELGTLQVVVKDALDWTESSQDEPLVDHDIETFTFDKPMLKLVVSGRVLHLFMHHAIYDGWSVQLIMDDVEKAYTEGLRDKRPTFKTFVQHLGNIDGLQAEAYWKTRLSGISTTSFPSLTDTSQQPLCNGSVKKRITFNHDNTSFVTVATLATASWAIVLSRYVSQEDICFGLITSGRFVPIDRAADIIGPFVSTVPMRVQVQRSRKVHEFLRELQNDTLDMTPHVHHGLQRIRKISWDALTACTFNNSFVFHPNSDQLHPSDILQPDEVEEVNPADYRTYPLHVSCTLENDGLSIKMRFDSSVIDQAQSEYLADFFGDVFQNMASCSSGTTLNDVLQTPARLPDSLHSFPPDPIDSCAHELIEKQARDRPSAAAVASWDRDLTFAELDTLATRLAHHLISLGVRPEVHTCFSFEKSALAVVVILGILKAGGACVPLDISLPEDRITFMVEKCQATIIVCSRQQASKLQGLTPAQLVVLDFEALTGLPHRAGSACQSVQPNNAAYTIFTSGSTGVPKGCTWEHRTLSSATTAQAKALFVGSSSRVLQFSAFLWDQSVQEVIATLISGGCTCLPSEGIRMSDIVGFMNEKKVNWAMFTPTFARSVRIEEALHLETLCLGGEIIGQDNLDRFRSRYRLVAGYGPTECCICASIADWSTNDNAKNGYIGKPCGACLWIVDPEDPNTLVPLGAVGEILIEGPAVGRGYLADPLRTEASFLTDLIWSQPVQGRARRFYRTGDLGKMNSDGTFNYLGRKDDQVKVRGQRLELGEVEHHLLQCDDVQQAMAFVPSSTTYNGRLVAVIEFTQDLQVIKPLLSDKIEEIERFLSRKMPSFGVPTIWLPIDKLPLTASGKLHRNQIRNWAHLQFENPEHSLFDDMKKPREDLQMPSTTQEKMLRRAWSEIFQVPEDQIGVNSSFYQLQGDSIHAIRLVSLLRSRALSLTVAAVFRNPVLRDMAAMTSALSNNHEEAHSPDGDTGKLFDLSAFQQTVAILQGTEIRNNRNVVLQIRPGVNLHMLKDVLTSIIKHHPMLRARLEGIGVESWKQKVVSFSNHDVCMFTTSVQSLADARTIIDTAQSSINPRTGPIMAAVTIETPVARYVVLIAHHMIVDRTSWRVLIQDFEKCLAGNPLPKRQPILFKMWVEGQSAPVEDSNTLTMQAPRDIPSADLDYWGLAGRPNLVQDAEHRSFEVSKAVTDLLLGPANRAFTTEPEELLLSGIWRTFGQSFKDRPIPAIFAENNSRESQHNLSRTVGCFSKLLPLLIPLDRHANLPEIVRQIKQHRRVNQQSIGANLKGNITEPSNDAVSAANLPMEVVFRFDGSPLNLESPAGLFHVIETDEISNRDQYDALQRFALFEFDLRLQNGCLHVSLTYDRHIRDLHRIHHWFSQLEQDLNSIATELYPRPIEFTTVDFPLLKATDADMLMLSQDILPSLGIDLSNVEDVYPCGPTQEGMLIAQVRSPHLYNILWTLKLSPTNTHTKLDMQNLLTAWKTVVDRHTILRTVFVQLPTTSGLIHQVVLKECPPKVFQLRCRNDKDAKRMLTAYPRMKEENGRPLHHIGFCMLPSGEVYCRLEISHAIADGATCTILWDDLCAAYSGRLKDQPAPPFAAFVEYLNSRPQDVNDQYWRGYLEDIQPCILPNSDELSGTADTERSIDLSSSINVDMLNQFCIKHEVTVSNVLHAAWAILLGAYTGSTSVCFGYVHSGRGVDLAGVQNIAGPILTLLICRVELGRSETFSSLIARMQADSLQSQEHQHFSFNKVARESSGSDANLFNTVLSVQARAELPTGQEGSIVVEHVNVHDPSEWDLFLGVFYGKNKIRMELKHRLLKINESHARCIGNTFTSILHSLLTGPSTCHDQITLLSQHDQTQIMEWSGNAVASEELEYVCVHEMIDFQAQSCPDMPAVCAWDGELTYAQLDSLSTRLSHYLVALGIKKEDFVPFCFEKTLWTVVTLLAVMKAGGAFVPLNPADPPERREVVIRSCNASVVLVSEGQDAQMIDFADHVLVVNQALLDSLKEVEGPACTTITINDIVYGWPTSGSTGTPKTVVIDHRAYAAGVVAMEDMLNFKLGLRTLQFASHVWDVCLAEILTALVYGGCVCIPSENDRLYELTEFINANRVEWAILTPSVARTLVPEELTTLQTLVLVGEAVGEDNALRWRPHLQLRVLYGLTETCTHSSLVDLTPAAINSRNIGRGTGATMWLSDPNNVDRLAPVGGIAEVLIEGPQLARCYLNDVQKSKAVFISDPAWSKAESMALKGPKRLTRRFVRSGDLARYNTDGSMTFIGRKDHQVKVRGQRLELGDVEHHLVQISKIRHVFTAVPASGMFKGQLVCALVLRSQPLSDHTPALLKLTAETPRGRLSEDVVDIEAFAKRRLPPHGVPSVWLSVEAFPQTPSGKLDRRTMNDWLVTFDPQQFQGKDQATAQPKGNAPSNSTQERVGSIWADILGVPQVDSDSSFLHLGGDSISTIRLVSALRHAGLAVPARDILRGKTVRELTQQLTGSSETTAGRDIPHKRFSLLKNSTDPAAILEDVARACRTHVEDVEDIYPATPTQEYMIQATEKSPRLWTMQGTADVPLGTDMKRLQEAWKTTCAANAILRTRMVQVEGAGIMQVVLRDGFRWTQVTGSEIDRSLARQDKEEMRFGGPLISFIASDDKICVTLHHNVFDFWSLPFIFHDAKEMYDTGKIKPRPHFQDFVRFLQSLDLGESQQYWTKRLKDAPPVIWPSLPQPDYLPTADTYVASHLEFTRNPRSTSTKGVILTAAWGLTISAFSGNTNDIILGAVLSGRLVPVEAIDDMMGPVVTLSPMRMTWDSTLPVQRMLDDLHNDTSDLGVHEHYGLHRLASLGDDGKRAIGQRTSLIIYPPSSSPLDDVSTALLSKMGGDEDISRRRAILVQAGLTDEGARMWYWYDSKVFDPKPFEEVVAYFESACSRMATEDLGMALDELMKLAWQDTKKKLKSDAKVEHNKLVRRL